LEGGVVFGSGNGAAKALRPPPTLSVSLGRGVRGRLGGVLWRLRLDFLHGRSSIGEETIVTFEMAVEGDRAIGLPLTWSGFLGAGVGGF
jgi:hypothetical protein